ncbi:MAG: hypothetical protein WA947_08690 [Phormidesmis sp.]
MNIPLFIKQLIGRFAPAAKPNPDLNANPNLNLNANYQPSVSAQATQTSPTEASSHQSLPAQNQLAQRQLAQNLSDQSLVREIRTQRKFTLAEAIGREGSNFMKGESAIPRPLRATAAINQFITTHLPSPSGPVSTVLQSWAKEDVRVSRHLDAPLIALSQIIKSLLNEPTTFQEFFRQLAIAQSKLTGDRPHFQPPNHPPHPDAVHSHESVTQQLADLLQKLQAQAKQHLQ